MLLSIIFTILSAGAAVGTFFGLYYPDWSWGWVIAVATIGYDLFIHFVYLLIIAIFSTIYQHSNAPAPEHPRRFGMFILEQTSWMIIHLFMGLVYFSGWGKLPSRKTRFMLVSNHISGWDHVGLFSLLAGRRLIAVSKKANEAIFGAGGWIKYAGNLAIDQGDLKQGQQVIEKAGNLIKNGECSVAIAPEGTRNKNFPDPMLLPFHPGSFQMAVKAKCPIVVIAIQNTNALFKRFPRWSNLYYDCVAVLDYETYKDWSLSEISYYCHGKILERLNKKQSRFYHVKKEEKKD